MTDGIVGWVVCPDQRIGTTLDVADRAGGEEDTLNAASSGGACRGAVVIVVDVVDIFIGLTLEIGTLADSPCAAIFGGKSGFWDWTGRDGGWAGWCCCSGL